MTVPNSISQDADIGTLAGTEAIPLVSGTSNKKTTPTELLTFVNAQQASTLAAKAPLASPAFSGTPTAPTAAVGTNTTQIATMAAVQAATAFTGFTAAAAATDTDTFAVNQGSGNLKQTFAAIKTWIKAWIAKADVGLSNVPNVDPTTGGTLFSGLRSNGTILFGAAQSNLGSAVNIGSSGTAGAAMIDIDNTDSGSGAQTSVYIRRNTSSVVGSISTTGSATSFNTTSDERLKDFLGEYDPEEAIRIIRTDPVRKFNWKLDGVAAVGWGVQTSYRVSSDLAVLGSPEDVQPDDEGFVPGGMDQSKRTPYLWAAVSRLLDECDVLKQQNVDLHQRVSALEA